MGRYLFCQIMAYGVYFGKFGHSRFPDPFETAELSKQFSASCRTHPWDRVQLGPQAALAPQLAMKSYTETVCFITHPHQE